MRKLTLAFFCCVFLSALFPALAPGQGAPGPSNYPASVVNQSGAPSVNCTATNVFYVNSATGDLYDCPTPGSAYVKAGNAGSGIAGSGLSAATKGFSMVGNGTNAATTSSNCVDATPYIAGLTPGQDYGPAINLMTTTFPNSCIDLRGLPTKVYLNSAMVTPACTNYPTCSTGGSFSGTILLGYTVFFINSGTGLQTFGSGVNVIGEGRTNSAGAVSYVAGTGTRFELCGTDTAAGDFTTYCGSTSYSATLTSDGNNYPAVITMNGYLPSVGAVGVSGTTLLAVRISGISVGCSMIANSTAFANLSAQEGSKFDNFYGIDCSGAGDIGLSLGGGTGGAQNSWATDFQFSTLSGRTNAASAVCVQVWGGTGNGMPSKIDKGSCVNNSVVGTLPNYAFQYVGGTTNIGEMLLEANHWESAAVCGVCVGVVTVKGVDQGGAANGLTVFDDNCGPGFGSGALSACYRIFSNANLTGALVTNFQVLGSEATGAGGAPLNLIGDDNNNVIPIATKFVVRYETDGTATGGKTISDPSGFNVSRFPGNITMGAVGGASGQITYLGSTSGSGVLGCTNATCSSIGISGNFTSTTNSSGKYATTNNCAVNSASPAACVSAASGAVVIPTTTTTYTINTTAVSAASRIQLTWLTFASNLPSAPTCVAPATTTMPTISNIVAATSFTITLTSTTGQTCPQFQITN